MGEKVSINCFEGERANVSMGWHRRFRRYIAEAVSGWPALAHRDEDGSYAIDVAHLLLRTSLQLWAPLKVEILCLGAAS